MTRYEKYKAMTIEEMAKVIIDNRITDKYCQEAYSCDGETCNCELECCIEWLDQEVKK